MVCQVEEFYFGKQQAQVIHDFHKSGILFPRYQAWNAKAIEYGMDNRGITRNGRWLPVIAIVMRLIVIKTWNKRKPNQYPR
jgi:hypothetical protein